VSNAEILSLVAWIYPLSNATRILTYVPRLISVWRCTDRARSVSILTWGSWAVSNISAVLYGTVVIDDGFFVAISCINLVGCAAVTATVAWRRSQWQRARDLARH
jgi:hypothetical protein